MKKNTFKIFSVIVFLVAMVMLALVTIPIITTYNDPDKFATYIRDFGPWSLVMMFFVQVAQIIVALIPGEVVEFVAGTLYGWLGGWIFCSVGIVVGQAIIFKAVKFFGRDFVEKVAGSEKINKYKFLQDETKLKRIIFVLFFIPGTPKDLLTYVVPLTKISLKEFLIITFFARIPSVISSTYAGDAFANQDFVMLAIVYGVVAAVSIGGVAVYQLWEKRREKKNTKKEQDVA